MYLSGFDEISEAVFETGTSLAEMAEQERKRSKNVYAPMLRVLSCVLLTGKVTSCSGSPNEENEFLEDESICRQSLSCGRLQMRGIKSKVRT